MEIVLMVLGVVGPAAYCLIRGAIDLAQRRYAWGTAGLVLGGLALFILVLGANLPPDLS